ncbi:UPF0271 protein [Pricia antarctica]|uniref:UPF0271 protein n=2 Tax=Pricia antarctica TaxID=641691 RepID=A0A1G7FMU5_9FLAO|nr:UPF0271 protein [Pricia antarctica]
MQRIIRLAKKFKVKVGAHPSYPDKENFGRSPMDIPSEVLVQSIQGQIADLVSILQKENIRLHHIKAHGALYNTIAKDAELAELFLRAVAEYKKDSLIYVPYASEIAKKAVEHDFLIAYEAFADRNYHTDLSLVSRSHPQALITSPEAVLKHIVQIVTHQKVRTLSDCTVKILAETFCIHSDTPSSFEIVLYLSAALPKHSIRIKK